MSFSPSIKAISTFNDLIKVVNEARDLKGSHYDLMFRGQGQDSWCLKPSIARNLDSVEKVKLVERDIVHDFAEEMVQRGFQKYLLKGFHTSEYHEDWLLIQQAQHYGIPTRFIDWTTDWKVALFFAVNDLKDDDFCGQFWVCFASKQMLVTDSSSSKYFKHDPFSFNKTVFLNSYGMINEHYIDQIGERRKFIQSGKFYVQQYERVLVPMEEQPEIRQYLTNVVIPKEIKVELREELASLKYTENSLLVKAVDPIDELVCELKSRYNLN